MAEEEDRKVIDLYTRQSYEAPEPEDPDEVKPPVIDGHAVEVLEAALAEAKAGELHGVIVLAGLVSPHGHIEFVTARLSETVLDAEQMFLGATLEIPDRINILMEADLFEDD